MGGGAAIVATVKRILSHLIDIALYGAIAFALYSFVSRKLSGPSKGVQAAAFDLPVVGESTGERFRLADHLGKPVLIEVFAGWCSACRSSAPTVLEAFNKHGRSGATFVGVSMDSSEADAARVKRDWAIPYDVVRDSLTSRRGEVPLMNLPAHFRRLAISMAGIERRDIGFG